ncbi:hypothetical protein QCA50_003086 [Cerrena zonata]|uniref:Uncharacterized protein n=1 Tax=Cerrena zonata TaxID=2478898 RepID=A0AAW0GJJ1_9APHY
MRRRSFISTQNKDVECTLTQGSPVYALKLNMTSVHQMAIFTFQLLTRSINLYFNIFSSRSPFADITTRVLFDATGIRQNASHGDVEPERNSACHLTYSKI